MRVAFSPEARDEFVEAERYYERVLAGLGARFRSEVRVSVQRIRRWPLAAAPERGAIRRMMLSRFPYKLLYSVESSHLYIIAVAHLHRAPNYWVERSPQ